jgi:hypothetical protein
VVVQDHFTHKASGGERIKKDPASHYGPGPEYQNISKSYAFTLPFTLAITSSAMPEGAGA